MLIVTKKIPPPRRPQIFNDHVAIDAVLAKQQERRDRWVKYMMDDLARAVRKIGGRKPS
jgi:hypothetical protein